MSAKSNQPERRNAAQPADAPGGDGGPDFEKAIEQIEKIIERIESGQIGLERSITEYERGVALIRRCRESLGRAELRVQELTAQMQADAAGKAPPLPDPAPDDDADQETPF